MLFARDVLARLASRADRLSPKALRRLIVIAGPAAARLQGHATVMLSEIEAFSRYAFEHAATLLPSRLSELLARAKAKPPTPSDNRSSEARAGPVLDGRLRVVMSQEHF
jgi:hypothetical protein